MVIFAAILRQFHRHEKLEDLFSKLDSEMGMRDHRGTRYGDEVIYCLLKSFTCIATSQTIPDGIFSFAVNKATSDIMRWLLTQYFKAPFSVESPTEVLVGRDFDLSWFSTIATLNLGERLHAHSLNIDSLLLIYFPSGRQTLT